MSGMKKMLGIAAMMTALAYGDNSETPPRKRFYIKPKETDEERKARLVKAERERCKAQGLTEFFYGENSLFALNQKSADRKARQRHWL